MANDCDTVLIGICSCHGWPYRGDPVVGAIGEMASMKRRKLWKTGRMGCVAPAVPSKFGWVPHHVFVVLLCCRLPPKWGKRPRYIDR